MRHCNSLIKYNNIIPVLWDLGKSFSFLLLIGKLAGQNTYAQIWLFVCVCVQIYFEFHCAIM